MNSVWSKGQTRSEALLSLARCLDVWKWVEYKKLGEDVHMRQVVVLCRESYGIRNREAGRLREVADTWEPMGK